jgi:ElaB/YqjD/DUF883 family membrane-anchored ribosome-binding protein
MDTGRDHERGESSALQAAPSPVEKIVEQARGLVAARPAAVLGVAAGLGVIAGWLIKRR